MWISFLSSDDSYSKSVPFIILTSALFGYNCSLLAKKRRTQASLCHYFFRDNGGRAFFIVLSWLGVGHVFVSSGELPVFHCY